MANEDLRARITLEDDVTSKLNRVISRFEDLTDDLRDLGSAFNVLTAAQNKYSKAAQQAGNATAKSQAAFAKRQKLVLSQLNELQKRAGVPITPEVDFQVDESAFREIRSLTEQIRSEVETGLTQLNAPTGIFDGLKSELRELRELSSASGTGGGNFTNLLNFEQDRAEAERLVGSINEIRQRMREIGDAAESGIPEAQDEFRQLAIELDRAEGRAEQLRNQLGQVADEFEGFVGDANIGLAASGIDPITFEDFFPTAEQKKLNQLQDQLDREIALKVDERAFQFTVNAFTGLNIQTSALSRNVIRLSSHLPRLRYAMYDVSNTAAIFGAALVGISAGAVKIGADFERAFADVRRTVGDGSEESIKALDEIRRELIQLSQEIPVSFEDLAGIATLAGQLNIAEDRIASFTSTVAQFTATTDVSLDAAATAFGRLDQLVAGVNGNFEGLASSILKVGVNAVATESDIIAISSQIASVANIAGFSADELIGFSSALASVGTRPELARGTFTRLFTEIQQAVAGGGEQLEVFARTAGQSVDEFTAAWGAGSGADQVIAILRGLQAEGKEADQVLAQLGITSVRDVPTLLKLAQGVESVEEQLAIAKLGFIENAELTRQYGILSATLSERLVKLGNATSSLAATIGSATGPIGAVVDLLTGFISVVQRVLDNPVGKYFSAATLAVTAFIGVLALGVSGIARAIASFAGMFTAVNETAQAVFSINTSVEALGTSMLELATSTGAANSALGAFNGQAQAAGFSAGRVAALTRASSGGVNLLGISVAKTGKTFDLATRQANRASFSFRSLSRIGGTIARFSAWGFVISSVVGALGLLADELGLFSEELDDSEEALSKFNERFGDSGAFIDAVRQDTAEYNKQLEDVSKGLRDTTGDFETFTSAVEDNGDEVSDRVKILAIATGEEELLSGVVNQATGEIERQTFAIGENTRALIARRAALDIAERAEGVGLQQVQELLRLQNVATAGPASGISAEAQGLARTQVSEQAGDVGLASIFQIIGDPQLGARIKQNGFDIQAFFDAAYAGNTQLANSIVADLEPAARRLRNQLQSEDAEKYADDIAYLNGVIEFGAQGLNSYASESGELIALIKQLSIEQSIFGENTEATTQSVEDFRNGLKAAVDDAYAAVNAERAVEDAMYALGQAFANEAPEVVANSREMQTAIKAIIDTASTPQEAINGLANFYNTIVNDGYLAKEELALLQQQIVNLYETAAQARLESLREQRATLSNVGSSAFYSTKFQQQWTDVNNQIAQTEQSLRNIRNIDLSKISTDTSSAAGFSEKLASGYNDAQKSSGGTAKNAKETADETERAAKEIRTLLDYASDLDSVISRAFDLRFKAALQVDSVTDSWESLREEIAGAQESVEELIRSQRDLSADRAIKEYFLSVAEAYDDQLRASKLRAEIAELDAKAAENQRKLTEQGFVGDIDTGSVDQFVLSDNSPTARRNRAALTGLVQEYQDYIIALAESGASQEELRKATERARKEFIAQATDLGYAEEDVMEYAAAFDDLTFAINNVPRNVTIEADVNPALTALRELQAQQEVNIQKANELNSALGQAPSGGGGSDRDSDSGNGVSSGALRGQLAEAEQRKQNAINGIVQANSEISRLNSALQRAGSISQAVALDAQRQTWFSRRANFVRARDNAQSDIDRIKAQLYTGGFTGQGGKYEPAGIVHRGEYVVPKNMVDQSRGVPKPEFLAQMQSMQGYMNGGFVGGTVNVPDTMMVELSPYDRELLEQAGNVQLRLDGRVIAQAANRNNVAAAQRGSN